MLEEKVSFLENIMEKLAYAQMTTGFELEKLSKEMREFKDEMREDRKNAKVGMDRFIDEMREDRKNAKIEMDRFSDEMREDRKSFKEEMQEDRKNAKIGMDRFIDEMREDRKKSKEEIDAFIAEMREDRKSFKDEMREDRKSFKDEMREDRKSFKDEMQKGSERWYKQWGELANKMGTVVEDIVVPNIPKIAEKYFNCKEIEDLMVRRTKKNPHDKSKRMEFDIIAVCDDIVILNETKSTPRVSYVNDFVDFIKNREFFLYFPEYEDKKLVPIFSSLSIPENITRILSKNDIYAMMVRGDIMDIVNFETVKKDTDI